MSTRGGAPVSGGAPLAYLPWVTPVDTNPAEPMSDSESAGARVALETELVEVQQRPTGRTFLEAVEFESDEADRADALVLKKLARNGLSQREVEVLLAAELTEEQVQFNISRYVRLGYLDDERLAEHIVRVQRDRKGSGRSSVKRELTARGIPLAVIERVTAELDDESEIARATELAESRLRRLGAESVEVQERRVASFLQRRGYSYSVATQAIRNARDQLAD